MYDYGKTICTHPNSFDKLQTEIVKVCNRNVEFENTNKAISNECHKLVDTLEKLQYVCVVHKINLVDKENENGL